MKTGTYTVNNKMGLHARPAAEIAKIAGKHKSAVTLLSGSKKANGKSVLMLTTLGAKKGTEITLQVEGKMRRKFLKSSTICLQTAFMKNSR